MKQNQFEVHKNCQVSIRYKIVNTSEIWRPALFCKQHNQYLKWLPKEVAEDLVDNHGVIEEKWDFTKKVKTKNSDLGNVLKKRNKHRLKSKRLNRHHITQTGRPL